MRELPPRGSGGVAPRSDKLGHVPMGLLEFYRRGDLPSFIKEWRRMHGSRPGAVQAWFDLAVEDGAYALEVVP